MPEWYETSDTKLRVCGSCKLNVVGGWWMQMYRPANVHQRVEQMS